MATQAAGLKVEDELVRPGTFQFESGYDAGRYFLGLKNPPTAIFSSNDDMAAGVVAALQEGGLKVPDDVSVVGFDDADIATRMRPFLTTIRQPLSDLGAHAVRELVASLNEAAPSGAHRIVLDHAFVLRGTTAPPRET